MRPIDADALRNVFDAMHAIAGGSHFDHLVLLGIKKYIDDAPTIDAVEVVRCRECVCCSMWNDQLICSRISDVMHGYYHGTIEVVKPDDYCSHGIRQRAKPLEGGVDNA